MPKPLRIDIVSDVVCPWCIVGYRQLLQALAETGVQADVKWHPFELNTDMAPEGQNLREHIIGKYGITHQQSDAARAQLTAAGAELGFVFNFSDDSRMVNTFLAHQLIEWADEQGRQTDMKLALFDAHFTDGRNVSDLATLVDVAAGLGLDADAARVALEGGHMAWNVRSMQKFWIDKGVRGVPAMVFDGQHLLTGAQGASTYAQLLGRLTQTTA
ncbi:MAG: disulfide bond formation protein DsbA [Rhodobacteraceae bacterium]|nr:MAG: disulfide bond formation protein DsbA [Paracoccaceae bacterium]